MRFWPPAATVQEASTGEEVLQAVQALPPDVIFLDLGLPEVDGIEVTYRLRRFSGISLSLA
ncbi:MAG TPA: response regulator [Bryobacteraceae bacterium]|nr:response regulator [Bryobacteraceae bacterium]HXJ11046.1 response regulator [Candidatus Limnocylindrales bacterium]HXJ43592.1 response regulator [Bryobacteraceae bacterium]